MKRPETIRPTPPVTAPRGASKHTATPVALTRTWPDGADEWASADGRRRIDLQAMLRPLRRGSGDPTWAPGSGNSIWRTTRTPDGPGVEHLIPQPNGAVRCEAYGPGAAWLVERLPELLGSVDRQEGFVPPDVLARTHRERHGWRVPRTRRVVEALVAAVLEQKVTGMEAWRAWRDLVRWYGEPAPAAPGRPDALLVVPEAQTWRQIPSWDWHRAGVDRSRSSTIVRALQSPGRLEECADLPVPHAEAKLRSLPGVGVWTVAEVAQRAWGSADLVSFRDFHLAKNVVFVLTGRMNGTDAEMAELLDHYAGHRYRVQRLVELCGAGAPRRGPRYSPQDLRAL